jgi:hypothetical protein
MVFQSFSARLGSLFRLHRHHYLHPQDLSGFSAIRDYLAKKKDLHYLPGYLDWRHRESILLYR